MSQQLFCCVYFVCSFKIADFFISDYSNIGLMLHVFDLILYIYEYRTKIHSEVINLNRLNTLN